MSVAARAIADDDTKSRRFNTYMISLAYRPTISRQLAGSRCCIGGSDPSVLLFREDWRVPDNVSQGLDFQNS
jgi:hypothetical protein